MNLAIYQVDAFTDHVFGGNPAAVIPLEAWLDDATLRAIANENNLSETAFIVAIESADTDVDSSSASKSVELDNNDHLAYELRWFTPISEVAMCGHGTLATAHVLFAHLAINGEQIEFTTKSGTLTVAKHGNGYMMDFPALPIQAVASTEIPDELLKGLFHKIDARLTHSTIYQVFTTESGSDYIIELTSEKVLQELIPDQHYWQDLKARRVIVTAIANDTQKDFVSRCFYTQLGQPEDPVTGSAHCLLTPYWAAKLGKNKLKAIQLSKRRGYLECELVDDVNGKRVKLIGQVVDYMVGRLWFRLL